MSNTIVDDVSVGEVSNPDIGAEIDDSIADDDISEFSINDDQQSLPSFGVDSIQDQSEQSDVYESSDDDSISKWSGDEEDEVVSHPAQKGGIGAISGIEEYDEYMFQKLSHDTTSRFVQEHHPECIFINNDEVIKLCHITRNANGAIIDPLHKTLPILTKYERARVIGQRAKQIENGCVPFIPVPENVISGLLIAEMELRENKIPFIIKRPIPNGTFEYWHLSDLEQINI